MICTLLWGDRSRPVSELVAPAVLFYDSAIGEPNAPLCEHV
jgi:hypothetical protein